MAEAGVEHIADSSGKTAGEPERAAFLRAFLTANDPALAEVITAWPTLPDGVRADIRATVRQAQAELPAGTPEP